MSVLHAENGKVAVDVLERNSDIDLILMDTMMPEMDGLAATRTIRHVARFNDLPIISLTAKAMMGRPRKGARGGASDYVAEAGGPRAVARGHPAAWLRASRAWPRAAG